MTLRKAELVTTQQQAALWNELEKHWLNNDFAEANTPAEMIVQLNRCQRFIEETIEREPLAFVDWVRKLVEGESTGFSSSSFEFYFLLFHLASELDRTDEKQALLFDEIEKERNWVEMFLNLSVEKRLTIEKSPETSEQTAETAPTAPTEKFAGAAGLDNNQIALLFYFLLKELEVDLKLKGRQTTVAKFLHLLTGKEFTGTNNSVFYDLIRKAPDTKKDPNKTKSDLQQVLLLFNKVNLEANEIEIAKKQVENFRSEK